MPTKNALVVDDSKVARLTLSKLLRAHEFEITEQASAEDALQWLQQTSERPDIIFMDVMMTGMDGLEATRQIKADPAWSDVPVVICTGKDTDADLAQALATGAAAVLSKPPAADALERLLADVVTVEPAAVTEPSPVEPEPAAPVVTDISEEKLAQLRNELMSELEQKITSSLAGLQQQLEQQSVPDEQPGLEKIGEISQQLSGTVQQQFSELKQSLSSQADDIVQATAGKAIDSAMNNFGLTEKLMVVLRSEGLDWLNKQQSEMRDTLQQELKQETLATAERSLDEQLETKLPALVKNHHEALLQDFFGSQMTEIENLKKELGKLRNIAIGAAVAAGLALILALV